MSQIQKLKDELTAVRTPAEEHAPAYTTEEEIKSNSIADHRSQEKSLIMEKDENSPQVTPNDVSKTVERQEPEAVVYDNPHNKSV